MIGEQLMAAMGTNDLYEVLGLEKRESSQDEIKKAYRRAALKHHPDKNGDPEKFKACSMAHSILSDVIKKEAYDQTGDVDDAEGHDLNEKNFAEWDAYFRALYPKLTIAKIDQFSSGYKSSNDEKEDLLKYYSEYKGDFKGIMSCVPLSENEDIPRFCSIIDASINNGEVELYLKYKAFKEKGVMSVVIESEDGESDEEDGNDVAFPTKSKKKNTVPTKAKGNGAKKGSKISAAKTFVKRKKKVTKMDELVLPQRGAGIYIKSIEEKYGGGDTSKYDDIDDAAFEAAQKRLGL